jgi:hypothetical protein
VDIIEISGRSPLTPSDGFSRRTNGELDNHASCNVTPLYQAHTGGPAAPSPAAPSPSGRAARWLDRTLRIVDEGPRPFYRAAVVSLAATSVLAMGVAALIRPHGSLPGTQRQMIAGALAGLCLSAILRLASLVAGGRSPSGTWLDRVAAPRERAAIWLALAAWFPFLLMVVYYRTRATFPPPVRYVYFPYDDKRWETAAYLLGVLAPAILLTIAARVLIVGRDKPPTWRAWFTGLFSGSLR